jgi:membrane-bound serine protease (ClpP class)
MLGAAPRVVAVDVGGVVHPVTVEIVSHAIDQAARENAAFLLIRINTPGGLMDAMRETVEKIVASPVPVVTYVTPGGGRAASAGFFILEAGDVAAMAPGTNTGAASPVLLGQTMDAVMQRKVENDAAALLRSLCDRRGRNAELAQKTVYEAKSFTDQEALDQKLIELVARDEHDLIDKLNHRVITRFDGRKQTLETAGAQVVEYQLSRRETIIRAIADPNIALILLVVGALGIYVEFSSPGLVAPGVAGAIMVLLGLSALSVLPINWIGAALLVLAVALFILEAKFATHGVLGGGGAVAMVLGAVLLIDSPIPELRIRWSTAIGVALPFALITMFLMSLVVRARANKVVTGTAGMMDEIAIAGPQGKVFYHGEYWDAVCPVPLEPGVRVRIKGIDGLTLKVEAVGKD